MKKLGKSVVKTENSWTLKMKMFGRPADPRDVLRHVHAHLAVFSADSEPLQSVPALDPSRQVLLLVAPESGDLVGQRNGSSLI